MSIIIKIVNPQFERKEDLIKLANFLLQFAETDVQEKQEEDCAAQTSNENYALIPPPPLSSETLEVETPLEFLQNFATEIKEVIEPTANVELDALGFWWDKRIHASTKTKTKDGIWKLKRDVDTNLVQQVQEEQKGIMQVKAPETTDSVLETSEELIDFAFVMDYATTAIKDKKITHSKLATIARDMGMPGVAAFSSRPDLLSVFLNRIKEECGE